nr:protein wntless isoform X1 [Halyomorpha halys]
MSGTVIENLSGKKLSILVICFFLCQITCFLVGGFIAPQPAGIDSVLATKCASRGNDSDWLYIRGKNPCKSIESFDELQQYEHEIVFVFQIPTPRGGMILDYSRWQQMLIGILHLDVYYHSVNENQMEPKTAITLYSKLGYKNRNDDDDNWKLYASSVEQRNLECEISVKKDGYPYNCSVIPLFELGSLHHDFYLLNIRLPVDHKKKINVGLGHIADMWLFIINQTGGFTKVWISLKCFFFPIIIGGLVWFYQRIHKLKRKPLLLESMLILVSSTLTLLNMPLEILTLYFELPFMLFFTDIRQGIFYASLLSFWLVFSGEHLMIQESQKHHLLNYWKYLSSVVIGCIALFFFDLCERGIQLRNPFYSIWATDFGYHLAMAFLIIGALCGTGYFLVLCFLIWKVFCNMRTKKASLPAMSQARRLHYTGIIYRFNFLMIATLLCAALTIISFSLGQVSEGQWKWSENHDLEFASAFFTGVYGMWNIYIFALLVLYAPSHKKWPAQRVSEEQSTMEEIEFSCLDPEPSEVSALTTFVKKTALD